MERSCSELPKHLAERRHSLPQQKLDKRREHGYGAAVHTFKLGVGPGHNWGMHGPVGLNSIGLVGILVGGGSLKWHILVLIPGSMLGHMRLNLVGRVLVLHP